MSLKTNLKQFDNLTVMNYFFEKKDDVLPLHTHTEETQHITIVLKGSVHLSGPQLNKILNQGEIYDYTDQEQTHEIKALQDNTIIINIPKKQNYEKDQEQFSKQYHEEFRRQQIEQILKTEQETYNNK